jgi:hypothetical protein
MCNRVEDRTDRNVTWRLHRTKIQALCRAECLNPAAWESRHREHKVVGENRLVYVNNQSRDQDFSFYAIVVRPECLARITCVGREELSQKFAPKRNYLLCPLR